MTQEEIKTIVQETGPYCLTYRRNGETISRLVDIHAVWEAGQCRQCRGVPQELILVLSKEWILLHEVVAIAAYQPEAPSHFSNVAE